jgi:hypothetical protein
MRALPNMLGLGLGTTDQVVPSHVSTRVATWEPELVPVPTAVHIVVERQDTPSRSLLAFVPVVPGLGMTDQVAPSQLSVSVVENNWLRGGPLLYSVCPDAIQNWIDRQDTASRRLPNVLGLGLARTDQFTPSTPPVSTRVWPGLPLLV